MKAILALTLLTALSTFAQPQAFEVGPHNLDQLPGGKEADGIQGDFILRNNMVEAVISGNRPHRKANMSAYWTAIAPGCLYDLTFRDENNDQLTIFSPSGQQGPVSYVRIVADGSEGQAEIETVTTSANNDGLHVSHTYQLKDNWSGILILTTLRNESAKSKSGTFNDRWTTFTETGKTGDVTWANAVDPADKLGYAFAWLDNDDIPARPDNITLEPGDSITFARGVAVGRSPAAALGVINHVRGSTGILQANLEQPDGKPITTARVDVEIHGKRIPAYPDQDGKLKLALQPGEYPLTISDLGRPTVKKTIRITEGQTTDTTIQLEPASRIAFDIRDQDGNSIPCKAQFIAVDETKTPNLGPQNRAHGCKDQWHSETGKFQVQIDPGSYNVIVTHGTEFTHLKKAVKLKAGATVRISGELRRVVDTRGWISSDFHNHSTPSGDNTCGTDDRIINLAAEQIEFAPTTEHNRIYDWMPHIKRLGLEQELNTVVGIELTGSGAHFNAFPYTAHPHLQDGGAPLWVKDPRLNAIRLREFQGHRHDRWVQINHPDMVENFIDRDGDGHEDGGYIGLGSMIDGAETWGLDILEKSPFYVWKYQGKDTVRYRREFIWLQLLNRGHRYWCVAVSDAHSVHGNGVGGWRTYVPSSTDQPAQIDWQEISRNSKAGRMIVTTGPFLEVTTEDGTLAGGTTRGLGSVKLHVKVQCTDWIDIDRVQILVNGRQPAALNFTRKSHPDWFDEDVVRFDQWIEVPLSEDSHIIAVAYGENSDLSIGYGSSPQASLKPCAYNNPIFVDTDGNGFTPNLDTLGWPLPTKGLSVEEARHLLDHFKRD